MYKTPRRKQSEMARTRIRIAKGLFDQLVQMAEKHIPRPTNTVFFEFVLNLGMDAYRAKTLPKETYSYKGDDAKPHIIGYQFKPHYLQQLDKLASAHVPEVPRRSFMEFIFQLGIEKYYEEYTIYGFRKD